MLIVGLPYMGSKKKLSLKIINDILKLKPNTRYIYDLFGGGGAISFAFLQIPTIKKVIYNDIDTGVVELIKYVLNNGVIDEMYKWVDRETFNKHKNDPTWYGGFLKVVWSFGNTKTDYLYGKDICKEYKERHFNIVNNNINNLLFDDKLTEITDKLKKIKTITNNSSERLIHIERIKHLEKISNINTDKLVIVNKDYKDVVIDTPIGETIIYLDPPYKDTHKYVNDIDYKELKEWIHDCKYPVFLSELNNNYDLKVLSNYEYKYTLSKDSNNTKVVEKLFWNGK